MNLKPVGRESDEQDSTVSVWGNYIMAFCATGGLIALDIFTDKGILDGTIIGMIIIKVWDGISKMNDYYFPGRRTTNPSSGNGEKPNA